MKNLFATRLSIARYRTGLSMSELAEKVNLSKQAISKYESGIMQPEIEVKSRLAEALSIDVNFFDAQYEPDNLLLHSLKHREKHRTDPSLLEQVKHQTVDALLKLIELEVISDSKMVFHNPIADLPVDNTKSAEKAAKILRKKWGLGEQPVRNVVLLFEEKGIKVFTVNICTTFQGLSAYSGKIPVIVLNSAIEEKTRLRFSAAHELGHLLLSIPDLIVDENLAERICDAFAGEFLFPTSVAIIEFGSVRNLISLEELVSLKKKYGVSIQSLMNRARFSNIITDEIFSNWKFNYKDWIESSADLGKYNVDETPQRFNTLVFHCLLEDKITISKASKLKNMKESQLNKFVTESKSHYKTLSDGNYYQ